MRTFIYKFKSLFQSTSLLFLVVPNPMTFDRGMIGEWNYSSCVAIGPNWAITARHTGGDTNSSLHFKGQEFHAVRVIPHPVYDLQLIEFTPSVTQWHPVRSTFQGGETAIIGGFGMTGDANGNWVYPRLERWGTNIVGSTGLMFGTNYSAPTDPTVTAHEAQGALNDSGGGIFSEQPNGELYLEGIIVSVTRFNQAQYGDATYYVNPAQMDSNWIYNTMSAGADFNRDGVTSVDDIYAFLNDWFARTPRADFDRNGIVSVDDIFSFLNAWFEHPTLVAGAQN